MKWRDHFSLREISPLRTGGATDYFYECTSLNDLIAHVTLARERGVLVRVIGNATSLLMSDSGFPGLIIRNQTSGILIMHDRSQVIVDAGIGLSQLVGQVISQGYSGLEFLFDAPGTIGGAVYNNYPVFGYCLGDYVRGVTVLIPATGEIRSLPVSSLGLAATTSVFKKQRQDGNEAIPIILTVTLQLSKMSPASCLQKIQHFKSIRAEYPFSTQPHLQIFNGELTYQRLQLHAASRRAITPDLFIDKNRSRQFRAGDIAIDSRNPNMIVNTRVGSSRDAVRVIESIKQYCEEHYKTTPSEQIEYLGVWDNGETSSDSV